MGGTWDPKPKPPIKSIPISSVPTNNDSLEIHPSYLTQKANPYLNDPNLTNAMQKFNPLANQQYIQQHTPNQYGYTASYLVPQQTQNNGYHAPKSNGYNVNNNFNANSQQKNINGTKK